MSEAGLDIERERVVQTTEAEIDAVQRGDSERYLSLLSRDAVFMPPNEAPKSGDALRKWLCDFLERVSIRYTRFEHGQTIVRDDVAIHAYSCAWTATPRQGGAPRAMAFKGMHVLKRQTDGSWMISLSIWNSDPEAPE